MPKQYLTLENAQSRLAEVKVYLCAALKIHALIKAQDEIEVECTDEVEQLEHDLAYSKQWHFLSHELTVELQKLADIGCIVKDLDEGLCDFYSLYEGEEILLCYKYGEEEITHWHDAVSGYNGRKPITEL